MNEDIAAVAGLAGDRRSSGVRPDLPHRREARRGCLERTVAEDARGPVVGRREARHPDGGRARRRSPRPLAILAGRLPEVKPWLAFAPGRFVAEREGGAWQVSPFVAGDTPRPARFAFEGLAGRGPGRPSRPPSEAARHMPGRDAAAAFSLTGFVRDLLGKTERPGTPASSTASIRPSSSSSATCSRSSALVPAAFSHGDFHPLNMIWSPTGIDALIDSSSAASGRRPTTPRSSSAVWGWKTRAAFPGTWSKASSAACAPGPAIPKPAWESFFGPRPGPPLRLAIRLAAAGRPGDGRPRGGLHRPAAREQGSPGEAWA